MPSALAQNFAQSDPHYTVSSTGEREGRLFIDYLRNGRGNTAVGAYSPRARPRFPASMPVSWAHSGSIIGVIVALLVEPLSEDGASTAVAWTCHYERLYDHRPLSGQAPA
jgi:hypothetical protein